MPVSKIVESPIHSPVRKDSTPPPPFGARTRLATGFWGLFDQGIVSLGNFFTNILLARHLSPSLYGIYGLIFGILLFFNNLHSSLITYPLSVEGSSGDANINREFAWASLIFTAMLSIPLGAAIGFGSWAAGLLSVAPWIIGALLLWQIQETLRRALMADHRYRDAVLGDAISYLGQAGGIWYLIAASTPSLEKIFFVMALSSAAGAGVQMIQLRIRFRMPPALGPLAKKYWDLGRWLILNNLVSLVSFQAVPWTLAASFGLGEAAKLLAMGNLLGVTHPAVFGIGNLIVPAAARANQTTGRRSAVRIAMEYGAIARCWCCLISWPLPSGPQWVCGLFTAALRHTWGLETPCAFSWWPMCWDTP